MAGGWARRRDTSADDLLIRQLYHQHGGALLAYATRLMGDRALGEDVVQETLVRAWRNPDRLTEDLGSVRALLFTITRNIAIDRHRARQARPAEVAETVNRTPVANDHADAVVDSMVVLAAMRQLSPEHQDVLKHLYFDGRTVEETAESLGVPAGTVKSRSYYALRKLRDTIAGPTGARPTIAEGVAG